MTSNSVLFDDFSFFIEHGDQVRVEDPLQDWLVVHLYGPFVASVELHFVVVPSGYHLFLKFSQFKSVFEARKLLHENLELNFIALSPHEG